jgi:hypothetical protein
MVYSLLVITARNWTIKESIQDLKIFFRRDSGFVQQPAPGDSQGRASLNVCTSLKFIKYLPVQWEPWLPLTAAIEGFHSNWSVLDIDNKFIFLCNYGEFLKPRFS